MFFVFAAHGVAIQIKGYVAPTNEYRRDRWSRMTILSLFVLFQLTKTKIETQKSVLTKTDLLLT